VRLDWECVRAILTALEDLPEQDGRLAPGDVPGWAPQVVSYHVEVLAEAGLLKAQCVRALGAQTLCLAQRLTFAGHELLDAMRQATLWNRVKARVRDAGLSLSVEAVKLAASGLIKELLQ
jgi:hypothetical protein